MDVRLEGILEDIARDPADRSLLAILADYLDDEGDPARARCIRIERELESLDPTDATRPRRQALIAERQPLWAENRKRWEDHPPEGVRLAWEGGRLEVAGQGECWMSHGRDWLLRQAPWVFWFSLEGTDEAILADLIPAGCLRFINALDLPVHATSGEGLAHVGQLPYLRELILWGPRISPEALAHLVPATQLQELTIRKAFELTDAQVAQVARLTHLRELRIQASLSDEAGAHLQQCLPQCFPEPEHPA